jgi:hypothetical protein
MIPLMGRLATGVREVEERLAGIARALQSAYEEEMREALQARDAAARNLARAEAMEQASRALGHDDLTMRLAEVIDQLRSAHTAAVARLAELAGIEKTVQLRLNEADTTSPATVALLPSTSAAPVAAPPRKPDDDLKARQQQLVTRIDEIERLARKWPKEIARQAIQEHVALARLLVKKLTSGGRSSEDLVTPALGRLRALADALPITDVSGWSPDETGDWSKIAVDARAQRAALVEARKSASAKPA